MGGSLGVLLPRDVAEATGLEAGTEVSMTVVGNQIVIQAASAAMDDAVFRRAMGAVFRRHDKGFKALSDYDRGEGPLVDMVGAPTPTSVRAGKSR